MVEMNTAFLRVMVKAKTTDSILDLEDIAN